MSTFESGPLEEILQLLTNFYKAAVGAGTTSTIGNVYFLSTLIQGEVLQEYDISVSTFEGMMATHLKYIRKVLLKYCFPSNALANQKRATRRTMHKPRGVKLQQFLAIQQEFNNIITNFIDEFINIPQDELNEILLHAVLHVWSNQIMILGFDLESKIPCCDRTFRAHGSCGSNLLRCR